MDFLTVVCASTIPTWALELGLLLVVAVICVVVYKLVYLSLAEKKPDGDRSLQIRRNGLKKGERVMSHKI